jgi:hypothetical protein
MSRPATDRLKFNAQLGTPPILQFVAPDQLHIDPTYQRTLDTDASKTLIRRIAQYWDWALCLPLVIARRGDGQLYVIDGQHRLAAATLRGDIAHMPAVVLAYPTIADEAANFVHINQQRRPLSKLDLFKAAVASGDSEATQIVDAVAQAGLSIAPHGNFIAWKPGMISNVGGVEASWRQHGAEVTRIALRALGQGFSGQVLRYAGTIFPGIAAVAAEEAKNFKPAFSPKSWDAFVSMIGSKSQEDWRSAVLMARAKDPNLSFGRASERVFLDAWEDDLGLDGMAEPAPAGALSGATPAPAAPPRPLLALLHSRLSLRRSPGRAARCGKAGPRSRPACSSRERMVRPRPLCTASPPERTGRTGASNATAALAQAKWRPARIASALSRGTRDDR